MSHKIGVLGSGGVGQTLANGFLKHGHEVMIGTNTASKREALLQATGARARVGTFEETAKYADIVVLATKGAAADAALRLAGPANLAGKTVLDATNPIADAAPVNGVLAFFTTLGDSLMERLQRQVPQARFVKAFSCVGKDFMVNPEFPGGRPSMFICGNDPASKLEAAGLLDRFGWEVEDMGMCEAARAIEPLCMLWCIPGLREGRWAHAFKLLKRQPDAGRA